MRHLLSLLDDCCSGVFRASGYIPIPISIPSWRNCVVVYNGPSQGRPKGIGNARCGGVGDFPGASAINGSCCCRGRV